ncbi:MFS transporter [Halomicrobium urmianum]|uniref:MFS transporter n=1 Tax=Halomicrobium urmianum TaxID=1586233 RepID=UPI001CDA0337|nr:MFS transporter [Halomicrobium urmianum]
MTEQRQFYVLYLTRFVGSLGFVMLTTLLPDFIDELGATGLVVGLFVTALSVGRTVAVVPLGWAADRYDKRTILLVSLVLSTAAYAMFAFVDTSATFVVARTLQGLGIVGVGLVVLALVGQFASAGERANQIGKLNSWRMAAGIAGSLGVGIASTVLGVGPMMATLVALYVMATVAVWLFVPTDETSTGFAFFDLALNDRILTITTFRAQYAVAVTLVRKWVPIFVGVSAAQGGLALSTFAVGAVVAAEKFTNMLAQPYTGSLSDEYGRALFVFVGGGCYGLVALVVPFAPEIGSILNVSLTLPQIGTLPPAFFIAVVLNGLLGIADSIREPASMALFADEGAGSGITSSFGIRGLVWRPGAILAPLLGGYLMSAFGMDWVFFAGALAAFSGILVFYGVLSVRHGKRALYQW